MNEFYRMIRMGVAGHVRGNRTETKLNFTANFYQHCKQETTRSTSDVIVRDFPLSCKRNYVVEEFSAKQQRAII